MKKMIYYFLFLFLFITFPVISEAASLDIVSTTNNISPSKSIVLTINANDFVNKFGSIHFDLKYDASKLSFVSSKAVQGFLTEEKASGVISVTLDKEDGMDNGKLYQITLMSNATATNGNSVISIDSTNDCFDQNLTMISVTGSTLTLNHFIASSVDTLNNLTVSNCELSPKFNSDTLNYTCAETTLDKVTVTGSVTDSKAKVIGLGVNKLEFGNNNISVIVIAENGNKKKYNINITRKDIRNANNSLSHLEVVGYNINFEPDILEYNLTVAKDVQKVTINGSTSESASIIKGLGEVELKNDVNTFFITVQAENGSTKSYRINILKKEQDSVSNTLLSYLSFNDIPIKLNENRTFLIGVPSNIYMLDLKYETSSNGVSSEVVGNNNFKEGINVVKIIIKAPNLEDTTYTLLVYKEMSLKTFEDFSEVEKGNASYYFNSKSYLNNKIPKSFFDLIGASNYFKYNIVNEYGGLLTSFKFSNGSLLYDDLEIIFSKINSKNLTYSSNIPENVLITLFLDTDKEIKIYNYNNGNYKLIDTVTPNEGYIEFLSNGSDNYVFSEENLFNELEKKELTAIKIVIIFIAGIIVGIILYYYLRNYYKKKINLEFIKL